MKDQSKIIGKEADSVQPKKQSVLYPQFKYATDPETGELNLKGIVLSDGSSEEPLSAQTFEASKGALKRATGSDEPSFAFSILTSIAAGMSQKSYEERVNRASIMLSMQKPRDETEAVILGQFIALQDSAMKCLGQANRQEMFYHQERFFILASKLFAQANAAMQALLKYRSGGQQTVQVVHFHNDGGQAIVAQNLSHSQSGEGAKKKNMDEPHGNL